MKALTIHQPWAELIARGAKRVENRTWQTHYRGPLAIHAGKQLAKGEEQRAKSLSPQPLALGAIIAVAELVACLYVDELRQKPGTFFAEFGELHAFKWLMDDPFAEGPWCWVLANVRRLPEPIPCAGKQGLWNVSEELRAKSKELRTLCP